MGRGTKPELDEQGRKKCPKCKQAKGLTEFPRDDSRPFGRHSWCYGCHSELRKKRYSLDYARKDHRKQTYGIDDATYQAMFEAQGGVCAVCKQPEKLRSQRGIVAPLAVDHCHKTGRVRALLCRDCNLALGYMEDAPERIKALLAYAEKWHKVECNWT
jgi:hypothetical protein